MSVLSQKRGGHHSARALHAALCLCLPRPDSDFWKEESSFSVLSSLSLPRGMATAISLNRGTWLRLSEWPPLLPRPAVHHTTPPLSPSSPACAPMPSFLPGVTGARAVLAPQLPCRSQVSVTPSAGPCPWVITCTFPDLKPSGRANAQVPRPGPAPITPRH